MTPATAPAALSPSRNHLIGSTAVALSLLLVGGLLTVHQLRAVDGTPVATQETMKIAASGDELNVEVPLLPGWALAPVSSTVGQYPSDRGIVVNPGLREQGYAPTVIITVDELGPTENGQEYAQSMTTTLDNVSTVYEIADRDVCGRTARLIEFTDMGSGSGGGGGGTQSGTGIVVVPDEGNYAYIAVLQTRNPDNTSYLEQREAMLSGFCLGDR